jgi:hypothetical protein
MFQQLLKHIREKSVHDRWVCFDFDGVCSQYHDNFEEDVFGDPIPGVAEAVKIIREEGLKAVLFTARKVTPKLKEWLEENGFEFDTINDTSHNPPSASKEKPVAELYVDDRGYRFDQNNPEQSIQELFSLLDINENLTDYAKEELDKAGLFDKDSDYGGMLGDAVMELMTVFSKQDHSGFSAQCASELFTRLANCKPLSPLTDDPEEWMEVTDFDNSGKSVHQSKRDPMCFSNDGGKTYYNVDDAKRKKHKSESYKKKENAA